MGAVVKVSQGELRGTVTDGVHVFLGIPYAAAAVGVNRMLPPRPAEPWSGVREATEPGPEPPQVAPPATGGSAVGPAEDWVDVDEAFAHVRLATASDDYLNVNLWTPDPAAIGLPVMVWIQGGMFEISSTAAYDGSRFARDGVVCVVINWRPGAEGLLYLGDGIANVGLLDQVAALEWVRDNIAAFGGDPGNVTVFGESAGAMSIGVLLAMPRAEGLCRRAILQSGAAHHVISAANATRIGEYLAHKLGVPATREAIAAVGIDRLLAAQAQLKRELMADPDPERWGRDVVASMMPWQPVIDGEILPGPPIERITAGAGSEVDVIVGTNTEDWRLWIVVSGVFPQINDEILTGPVAAHGYLSLGAYCISAEEALSAYRDRYPESAPGDLLAAVQTDWWTRIPAIRLADAHAEASSGAGVGSTYMYEFAWPSPGLGAVHALEVPFVFDTARPDAPLFGGLLGDDPPQELAHAMHAAWVDFATHGDPGWPRYDPTSRATMRFDTISQVVDDPRAWERGLWEGVR
ncbi:carboxylesterase/lipase family protein [Agromyces sp. Marseille-P2726]|uniref:carboxylesterase/lipase family protein n=1 Tax=Agromyces sp. Marseille-P2726 TaxID=2709132 RepID=UPI00156FF7CD|nr:carboxylesterase family protein [Agromyces sp. Marseille-P2726]